MCGAISSNAGNSEWYPCKLSILTDPFRAFLRNRQADFATQACTLSRRQLTTCVTLLVPCQLTSSATCNKRTCRNSGITTCPQHPCAAHYQGCCQPASRQPGHIHNVHTASKMQMVPFISQRDVLSNAAASITKGNRGGHMH
jgi:hypothetical protein